MEAHFDADLIAEMKTGGLFTPEQIAELEAQGVGGDKPDEAPIEKIEGIEAIEIADVSHPVIVADGQLDDPLPEMVLDESEMAEVEGAIASVEAREAIYASQESVIALVPEEEIADPLTAGAKPIVRKAREKKTKSTADDSGKRVSRVASAGSLGKHAAVVAGGAVLLVENGTPVDPEALVDGIGAVKIRDKAVNFLDHFHKGAALSVFTKAGFDMLLADGEVTLGKLIKALHEGRFGKSYSDGTSRSQGQQVVALLKTFGVINAAGRPVDGSTYLAKARTVRGF